MSTDPKVRLDVLAEIQIILDKPSKLPDRIDHDDLLRDAIRISLLQHNDMFEDEWQEIYDTVRVLMARYIASPEGHDAEIMMARLCFAAADVVKGEIDAPYCRPADA
jgi:hypothetical protein